jgi:hypothetical protein
MLNRVGVEISVVYLSKVNLRLKPELDHKFTFSSPGELLTLDKVR